MVVIPETKDCRVFVSVKYINYSVDVVAVRVSEVVLRCRLAGRGLESDVDAGVVLRGRFLLPSMSSRSASGMVA